MQHPENYQQVLVSKTVFKKLVHAHAVCSDCGMPADIHGGYMPCRGAHIIVDMEIINAVATKTPEPDGRPAANPGYEHGGGNPNLVYIRHCEHGHVIGNNRTCGQCESAKAAAKWDGLRFRE